MCQLMTLAILKVMIVGIDEVGRGCWAGPLVAGAVVLEKDIPGLADSKQLSAKQRELLATQIQLSKAAYSLGWVTPSEVDELGLTVAVRAAMERAIAGLTAAYDAIVIDGNFNFLSHVPHTQAIIKADATVPAVSAASILAKVARDEYMREQALRYPMYGFDRHVGYGTAAHAQALREFGVTPLHRRSYKPVQAATIAST